MSKKKAKTYTAEFKAKVALESIRGDLTINQISSKFGIHYTQINRWKSQALDCIRSAFTGKIEKLNKTIKNWLIVCIVKLGN